MFFFDEVCRFTGRSVPVMYTSQSDMFDHWFYKLIRPESSGTIFSSEDVSWWEQDFSESVRSLLKGAPPFCKGNRDLITHQHVVHRHLDLCNGTLGLRPLFPFLLQRLQ